MIRAHFAFILFCFVSAVALADDANKTPAAATTKFVPFYQVSMHDPIWQPRIRLLVTQTLPHAFENTKAAQRRLQLCAEWLESGGKTEKPEPHRFNTSDLYKVMEGAALMIQSEPNADIEALMDRIIDVIARAQAPDGYLYVAHITGSIIESEMGKTPYSYELHSHELYNKGHLYEAAVAYAQATGKTKLLDVAEKNARHVQHVFFEGDPNYNSGKPVMQAPGHQEIELGLIKLYAYTGKQLYLDMAKRFLDIRGVTYVPDGQGINSPEYAQQHAPVAKQMEAVGHAVRATYQYAAMAEVDSLTNKQDYSDALDHIWHDIVDKKMHITGGLGAVHGIEGFGPEYVLPNKDTYLETCAAVGNVFFNMRMFLKYKDAKYIDVAEVSLLNNCLAGMGASGKDFFYPNPLEADFGHAPRSAWFGTACCPSNIARLIPQVSGYMYATSDDGIYCTLYGSSRTKVSVAGTAVELRQEANYPWSGDINLEVHPESPSQFPIHLRIPTWAGQQFVPGALYSYSDEAPKWTIRVNGNIVSPAIVKGFAVIDRQWTAGDTIELDLPMPLRVNRCDEKVAANRDRISFTRGPLVMCAEGIDNGGAVQRYYVDASKLASHVVPSSDSVHKLDPNAVCEEVDAFGVSLQHAPAAEKLVLLPYFLWSNRDRSSMQVWFPTKAELSKPDLFSPENLKFQSATASHTFDSDTVEAVRMRHTPKNSHDMSIPRWTGWPQTGKTQWVEIDLGSEQEIRSIGAYFYNDDGGVQLPAEWFVETEQKDGRKKLSIYNTDNFSTLPDTYNTVHPAEILKARKLRITMKPRHNNTSVGLLSVEVETRQQ